MYIPGESEIFRVIGGYFLGVCMTPTEAEMRSAHIHSQHIQFFGWDIQPAEKSEAAAESESPDIREYVRKIVPTYTVKGNQNHVHEQDSKDTVFTEGLALQPDHARRRAEVHDGGV